LHTSNFIINYALLTVTGCTESEFTSASIEEKPSLSANDSQCCESDDRNATDSAEHSEQEPDPESNAITTATTVTLTQQRWENRSFLIPLQLLNRLSGYPNLLILYSILACLPVSSASAERALSKLKIVKNRLRTSLSDNIMSALLILASEKDMLAKINNEDIINRMAMASPSLKSLLLF
jgi:hypothetical protein